MKLFKKKNHAELSEQAELEIRERLTYLEEKVEAQAQVMRAQNALLQALLASLGMGDK